MLPRAAIHAVDLLMQKFFHSSHDEYQRAFVVGRPPGHHAGPFGWESATFFTFLRHRNCSRRLPLLYTNVCFSLFAVIAACLRLCTGSDLKWRLPGSVFSILLLWLRWVPWLFRVTLLSCSISYPSQAYARQHYGRMAMSNSAMSKDRGNLQSAGRTLLRPPRIAIIDFDIHHGMAKLFFKLL